MITYRRKMNVAATPLLCCFVGTLAHDAVEWRSCGAEALEGGIPRWRG